MESITFGEILEFIDRVTEPDMDDVRLCISKQYRCVYLTQGFYTNQILGKDFSFEELVEKVKGAGVDTYDQ